MKKAYPYLFFGIVVIATVLNIIYKANIITEAWVRVGGIVVLLGAMLERFIYDNREESPLHYRSLKKRPITSVLILLFALAFVVTYAIARIF